MSLPYRFIFFIIGFFIFFGISQPTAYAQTDLPELYFCVEPKDTEKSPYMITFLDSFAFGILIPEEANITIYTNTFYTAALYTVNTSARSGGYLRMEHLSSVNTMTQIPIDNPCLTPETEDIFATLPLRTIALPVSVNHAIVVQQENSDELENPFQRIISFTFGIGGETPLRNIQVIQVSEFDPFLNFRYFDVEPNTPFMVIANKDFGIGQSLANTDPPEFSRERPSDIRSFVKSDLEDLYGLDIFEVARQSDARIYINSGLLDTYRGTYIRISLAPDTVERIPPLEEGILVKALPNAIASFISTEQIDDNPLQLNLPFDSDPLGQLIGDSVYRITEINDLTGQLLIDFNDSAVIVQSWLVEAAPSE